MADTYVQHEEKIQRALKYISTKTSYVLTDVARMYGCDYHRLRRRVKGIQSKSTRQRTNAKLNPTQLKALELYIQRLDKLGQPPLPEMVRSAAESIRMRTTPIAKQPDLKPLRRDYITRLIAKHPVARKVRQKPQENTRVFRQVREVYTEHFKELQQLITDLGIQASDCWNMDECGFRIGIGGSQDVITMERFRAAQSLSETNRDFTTIVEAINAARDTIPPLAIIKGSCVLFKHVSEQLQLDPKMLIGASELGYSND